jgi:hypothetical protein
LILSLPVLAMKAELKVVAGEIYWKALIEKIKQKIYTGV